MKTIPTLKKVLINSQNTPFTIDTYCVFDMESDESYYIENLKEDGIDENSVELEYDMDGYRNSLAECLVEFLRTDIPKYIIKSYTKKGVFHPKYYNYSTDSVDIEMEYDSEALDSFIQSREKEYLEYCKNQTYSINFPLDNEEEKIEYYIETLEDIETKKDDWIMYAYEYADAYSFISHKIV